LLLERTREQNRHAFDGKERRRAGAGDRGRVGGCVDAVTLAARRAGPRAAGELVAQRAAAAKDLAGLQVEKAEAEGDRRIVEADLGPVRYLAALFGASDENVMRWFILVVALLLDPAAVLLLLAAVAASARPDFCRTPRRLA
jgi:hypothetical protein